MNEEDGHAKGVRLRAGIPALALMLTVFVSNMTSRSILSPLLLRVEQDFSVSHGPAAQLFLFISIGYSISVLFSGFVSSKTTHRGAILVCALVMSAGLLLMSLAPTMNLMRAGVLLMGAGSGLYPPSSIATITNLFDRRDWQKALSIHEIGPHIAMVLAPLYVNLMLNYTDWRGTIGLLAVIILISGSIFFIRIKAGTLKGEAPTFSNLLPLFREPNFWILMLFFGLALGSIQGIYMLVPTFLVAEAGFTLERANSIFGISRFLPIVALLTAGLVMDRIGLRRTLMITLAGAGLTILLMGFLRGPLLVTVVFLQPTIGALYFPAGLAALAKIGPPQSRNVSVSMVLPVSALIGTGIIPAFLGYMGDILSFSTGFLIVGITITLLSMLARFISIAETD
ncbi:MAG: MFS transporter [Spirochaetia bacterium]|nr:MFS transporter [Spirochaetia bacterium]